MAEGTLGSKDFEIKKLELINSGGQTVDLRYVFIQMQIYQDIYSSVMSGNILVNDSKEIFSNFYLCGNEYLHAVIDKPGLNRPFEKIFRVYKTTDRKPVSNSGQAYTLHFCSDEMISSEMITVSKAYKAQKINNIVADILSNELKIDPSRINSIEVTSGVHDFVIPAFRPFEAIQWVASRAYDVGKFCYFFFENKDGFNFISLQSLFQQTPYKKMKYEIKNVDPDPSVNKDSVDDFTILNDFDMLTSIGNGAFASRLLAVDIFSQSHTVLDYNLNTAESQGNLLNDYKPVNSFKNAKNESLFNAYNSFFRTYVAINDTASEKSNDIKFWMMPRALHMTMLNHFKIQIVVPGDIEMKAGDVVEYEMPTFQGSDSSGREMDKKRTGKYLVTSINHKFIREDNNFECVVELASDSFAEALPAAKDGLNKLTQTPKKR